MFLISAGRLFTQFTQFGSCRLKGSVSKSVGRHRALASTNKVAFLDLRAYPDWAATSKRSTEVWLIE